VEPIIAELSAQQGYLLVTEDDFAKACRGEGDESVIGWWFGQGAWKRAGLPDCALCFINYGILKVNTV
jgi:hypothetical protein